MVSSFIKQYDRAHSTDEKRRLLSILNKLKKIDNADELYAALIHSNYVKDWNFAPMYKDALENPTDINNIKQLTGFDDAKETELNNALDGFIQ